MIKIFKSNYYLYFLEFITTFMFGFYLFRFGMNRSFIWLTFSGITLILLISEIMFSYRYLKDKKEKIFLLIAIPVSILYSLFLAPYRIMDETAHLVKNIDLSNGNLITKKDKEDKAIVYVPEGVNEIDDKKIKDFASLDKALSEKTDYENLVRVNPFFTYTVINTPTPYLLSALGFKIGSLLNLNFYLSMYLAKLFNILLYLVVGYWIIKLIPFGKLFMLVYLLNPMLLQGVSSIGADNFTNLMSLLWISYILYLRFRKEKIKNKEIVILSILMLLVSTSKFIYFPLLLLLLLLKNQYQNHKQKKVIAISILLSLILTGISIYIGLGYDNEFVRFISGNNIDAIKQLKGVITKPWNFIIGIVMSIYKYHGDYITEFFGYQLGNTDITLMYGAYLGYIIIFIASLFMNKERIELTKKNRYLLWVTTFILIGCIFGVEYLTWNSVNARIIEGIQGRYFIPFMIIPCILIINDKIKISFKNNQFITVASLLIIHLLNIFVLFRSYM